MEELMEMICDRCHYPWITTQEELEDYCAECEIEKAIKRALREKESEMAVKMAHIIADSIKEVRERVENGQLL